MGRIDGLVVGIYSSFFPVDGVGGEDSLNSLTSLWGLPLPWQCQGRSTCWGSSFRGFTWIWGIFVLASEGKAVWREGEGTSDVFNPRAPKVWSFPVDLQLPHLQNKDMQIGVGGGKGEGREENRVVWGIFSFTMLWGYKLNPGEFIFIIMTRWDLNALFKTSPLAPIGVE